LVPDLDEAIKDVKLLGENAEESSQNITELETLCKKLREDTQRLEEEKATLEGMVESRNEVLMEIAREMGLGRMGEDEDDDEEEEDADNGGNVTAPPTAAPPPPARPAVVPEEINEEGPVKEIPEQEAPRPHELILADAEPEMLYISQLHFNEPFSYNKVSIENHLVFSYLYGFIPYSFTPAIVPLGILYLINAYTSDGQHKEPQQQQQQGQQRREQPECEPAATLSVYS
jgi:hypothetical protein